ncbi:MAG TPA: asparagine synthase (glutamine-hydrolyzing), partial [Thermoplasmata archaeon]|nr:asparagine synthase (glutamine-hydrolyzing) [Thermoplasmata archaeon]
MTKVCGIAAAVSAGVGPADPALVERMLDAIRHRGPDDRGSHVDGSVALGNVRLSIIDLSPDGRMPMRSPCHELWLTHNGEVYNHVELREELEAKGHSFRSRSDSEVILHAYEEWGEKCVDRFNGMFAFAIWDPSSRTLFCARDRFGVKPLYYFETGGRLLLASEIKAILADPSVPRRPDHQAILDYLVFGITDHAEATFFEGIRRLEPGHLLIWKDSRKEIKRWWTLGSQRKETRYEEAVAEVRRLFEDSVRIRLRSDVPVGS